MTDYYVHDGGLHDFPEPPDYDPRDDDGWDDFVTEVESLEAHYADEINGRCMEPVDDIPPATAITNAPGQLRFSFGDAAR